MSTDLLNYVREAEVGCVELLVLASAAQPSGYFATQLLVRLRAHHTIRQPLAQSASLFAPATTERTLSHSTVLVVTYKRYCLAYRYAIFSLHLENVTE